METAESLKRRIRTAEDLHSLVRTMKALAAVNIRQLEQAVASLSEYRRTVELGLQVALRQTSRQHVTARRAPHSTLGCVVLGTDQGMCGPLNDQIVRSALDEIDAAGLPAGSRATLAVGVRAASRLEDAGERLEATLPVASSTAGITPLVEELLLHIEAWHRERGVGRIVVCYCEHTSRAAYRTARHDLLPIDRAWLQQLLKRPWPTHVLPTFTMDADQLFSALVRQYLFISLYRACAESMASENTSRLAAMRGAERNISDRITELTGWYHQTRQMAITEELLDITSGFEALDIA